MIDIKDIYYGMQETQKVFALLGAGIIIGFGISKAVKFAKKKLEEKRWVKEDVGEWLYGDGPVMEAGKLEASMIDAGKIVSSAMINDRDFEYDDLGQLVSKGSEKPDIFSVGSEPNEHEISDITSQEYTFKIWAHRHSMVYYVDDDILADAESLEEVPPEEMYAEGYLPKLKDGESEDVYYSLPAKMEAYEIIASHGNYLEEYRALEESQKEAEAVSYENAIKIAGYSAE